jgi:hypothetical protein
VTHADTNGLLDRCDCGAFAGFEESELGCVRARCTECCICNDWAVSTQSAAFMWNVERRMVRDRKEATDGK